MKLKQIIPSPLVVALTSAILFPLWTSAVPLPIPQEIDDSHLPLSDHQLKAMGPQHDVGTQAARAVDSRAMDSLISKAKDYKGLHDAHQTAADVHKSYLPSSEAQFEEGKKQAAAAIEKAASSSHPEDLKAAQQAGVKAINAQSQHADDKGGAAGHEAILPHLQKAHEAKTPEEAARHEAEGHKAKEAAAEKASNEVHNEHFAGKNIEKKLDPVPGVKSSPEVEHATKQFHDAMNMDHKTLANPDNHHKATQAIKGYEHAEANDIKNAQTNAQKAAQEAAAAHKMAEKHPTAENKKAAEIAQAKADHAEAVHKAQSTPGHMDKVRQSTQIAQKIVDGRHNQGVSESKAEKEHHTSTNAADASTRNKHAALAQHHTNQAAKHNDEVMGHLKQGRVANTVQGVSQRNVNEKIAHANKEHETKMHQIEKKHGSNQPSSSGSKASPPTSARNGSPNGPRHQSHSTTTTPHRSQSNTKSGKKKP